MKIKTKVSEIIKRTHNVKSIRCEVAEDVKYSAGQYMMVALKNGEDMITKPFTISSSPTEKGYVEFTKKLTGSSFSNCLNKLREGEEINIDMPYGDFILRDEYNKIAFLSGGIGITPIRSICRDVVDNELDVDVVLFYSNRTEADIVFKDEFDDMNRNNRNMNIIYTLTDEQVNEDKWNGYKGYINRDMIIKEAPDYKDRVFYSCGPPKMVDAMIDMLRNEFHIADDRIKRENFAGY